MNIDNNQNTTQCSVNCYKHNNLLYFNELNELIKNHPKHYSQMLLKSKQYLYTWINQCLPLLDDSFAISTKCYWIINGLIEFPTCKKCGKVIKQKYVKINKGYGSFCSNYCVTHSNEIQNKREETCLKKYGVKHVLQHQQIKEKFKQTCAKKYNGIPFSKQSTIYNYLYDKLSILENKKVINPMQVKAIADKAKQTKLNKYGKNCFDIEKLKQHNIKKYGVPFYFMTQQFKDYYIQLFGVDNVFKLKKIQDKCRYRYTYNNINFDSAPEIAYYIWLTDNNIMFEYQPNIKFQYEYNGKKYHCFPDFKVENKLYEIKGDHFLKSDGTWQCPFDHSADAIYEAKHQCLLKNNVNILYSNEYKIYLDYVIQKYGKKYLSSFKNISQKIQKRFLKLFKQNGKVI